MAEPAEDCELQALLESEPARQERAPLAPALGRHPECLTPAARQGGLPRRLPRLLVAAALLGAVLWAGCRWSAGGLRRSAGGRRGSRAAVEAVAAEEEADELFSLFGDGEAANNLFMRVARAMPFGVGGDSAPEPQRELLSTGEWRPHPEWQVTFDGPEGLVNVRSEKSMSAEVIAQKPRCEIFSGRRDGEWVALVDEPGYVRIAMKKEHEPGGRVVLLKERVVAYEKLSSGLCEDVGKYSIQDEASCLAAAAALGLAQQPPENGSNASAPPGCRWAAGAGLRMSPPSANASNSSEVQWERLCSTEANPCRASDASRLASAAGSSGPPRTGRNASMQEQVLHGHYATTTTARPRAPRLFCFSVARVWGYEPELLRAQEEQGVGIFACEEQLVFSTGGNIQLKNTRAIALAAPKSELGDMGREGTTTTSWLNTMAFIEAWDWIDGDGVFRRHDWTVKVDPDTVFFPDRLRQRLAHRQVHRNGEFVVNCNKEFGPSDGFKDKLFGSIEVFSAAAVDRYATDGHRCKQELQWHGWGEDFFMQSCMYLLGVEGVSDFEMASDKRCHESPCSERKVAFHDFKDVGSYFDCWGQSSVAADEAEGEGVTTAAV